VDDFSNLNLIGDSAVFRAALTMMRRMSACDATVLIQGEIGTGKELAARAIHYLGARRHGPFIPVNCGGVPDSLFENELFGHVRGAFTDARSESIGLIANAEGGTLFLDEVEALSAKGQVALLRFLQDGTYRPLGGKRLITANVRVVAASNASLSAMATRGEFRADLMYRLTVMPLDLPPLRARGDDIRVLAEHFIARFNAQYRTNRTLSPGSLAAVAAHDWPGNVRELENLLHREVLLSDTDTIELAPRLPAARSILAPAAAVAFESGFQAAKASSIAAFERSFVCWALAETGGNLSQAAKKAGKERRSFSRLVKKHGVDRGHYAS
jgi:DNA-binding NtrC family response regulator